MSETQESHESLHTEVEIKPTLNERALLAIGHPLTQEENNRFYAKIQKSSEDIKGPFVCLVCAYSSREWNVKVHVRTHTGEPGDEPYQCKFCLKKFTRKSHCDRHIRSHTGERPFKCTFCSKKFAQKPHCETHIRTHTGEKLFQCTFCPKKFTRKGDCEIHIQTHSGEKPYSCTFCPNKFTRKDDCERHIQTHSGEKRYSCTFCPCMFTRKDNCERHIQTHTGEKPYSCTFCPKKFATKQRCDQHIRTHNEDQNESGGNQGESGLYGCQLCFKTFQNVDQLRSHELEHTSSADLFEEGLEPADPSTSETSISVAAPTEEITIEEIKLEVEDDIDSDPIASILQELKKNTYYA